MFFPREETERKQAKNIPPGFLFDKTRGYWIYVGNITWLLEPTQIWWIVLRAIRWLVNKSYPDLKQWRSLMNTSTELEWGSQKNENVGSNYRWNNNNDSSS